MRKPPKDINLTSYDELLGIHDEGIGKIVEIPLSELHSFSDHPFHVKDDEKMQETVESIKRYGVLNPAIVRPRKQGGYEIVAGHRRKRGCELAGLDRLPAIVRNYTDDEATIIMVDSNIQRENILPSEKAFAYKMKLAAMRHQGIKTCDGETADLVGKEAGDSGRKVQRYIRLTELLPELLELVDGGMVKIIPAVDISYLTREEQGWVFQCIVGKGVSINGAAAQQLKKYSAEKTLTELAVELLLCSEKKEPVKVTLQGDKVRKYFPKEYSSQQIEAVIYELLDRWKNAQ